MRGGDVWGQWWNADGCCEEFNEEVKEGLPDGYLYMDH